MLLRLTTSHMQPEFWHFFEGQGGGEETSPSDPHSDVSNDAIKDDCSAGLSYF